MVRVILRLGGRPADDEQAELDDISEGPLRQAALAKSSDAGGGERDFPDGGRGTASTGVGKDQGTSTIAAEGSVHAKALV